MNQEPQLSLTERINRNVNFLVFISSALALPPTVFLHRNIGSKYVGAQALLTLLLFLLAPLMCPRGDPQPLVFFFFSFLFMCLLSRAEAGKRRMQGDYIHRYYNGYPRLLRFFPKMDEVKFKRFEALLVIVIGLFLCPLSQMLGQFIIVCGVGLGANLAAIESAERERVETMLDQQIEQQQLLETFRRLRGK